MAAPIGNKYWQFRNKHGRDKKYTPDELWKEFVGYAEWVEANPLKEEVINWYQGEPRKETLNKMRAMTMDGFYLYADIDHTTFRSYKENKDYTTITNAIIINIREQKFTGAAAELLNPNIIARDLGLTDKRDNTHDVSKEMKELLKPFKVKRANDEPGD